MGEGKWLIMMMMKMMIDGQTLLAELDISLRREGGAWLIRVYGKPPLIWASANIHHLNNMRMVRIVIVLMTMRTNVEFCC